MKVGLKVGGQVDKQHTLSYNISDIGILADCANRKDVLPKKWHQAVIILSRSHAKITAE